MAVALLAGFPFAVSGADSALTYPTKPIRMIVGFPPGGAADILGRITAQKLAETLGQQVVVDNRGGAGGNIATELVSRASPDGYTIQQTSNPHVINPHLYRRINYHPIKDFTAIGLVVSGSMLLAAHPAVPFRNVSELVAAAKASPGKLSYGSGGAGASGHLAMEMFKSTTGIDLLHVPYKGTGPVINDLIAGQIQLTIGSAVPLLPQVRAGKLRAIAVTGLKRTTSAPDVPTVAESGFPGFEVMQWFGVIGPAGMPRPVVSRLNTALRQILTQSDARDRYAAQSVEPSPSSPAEHAAVLAREYERWGKIVRALDLKVD